MHVTLLNRFCLLSIVCLVLALPAWAEEEPNPPQDDASEPASDEGEDGESGEDGPSPSEPCDSDEDCPEGYICEQGYYGDTDYDDGYEDEDEGGEGAPPDTENDHTSNGYCVRDYSCDTNDDCADGEFCQLDEYIDCSHSDGSDELECTSVQEGWCSWDYRDDCVSNADCDFTELCHQRDIDDHAHCTPGFEVSCSDDSDCGDRLVCEEAIIDYYCDWDEASGEVFCEPMTQDRCIMRPCTDSDVCREDEICVRMFADGHHPPPPMPHETEPAEEVDPSDDEGSVDDEDGEEDEDEPQGPGDEWYLPEEGVCAPPAEGDCEADSDCEEYQECVAMGNLPCFDGDTKCEEATVDICADQRMECDEDSECPSDYYCSHTYSTHDPFDYGPGHGGEPISGTGEVGPIEPSDEDEGDEEDVDDDEEEGDDDGDVEVHPPGEPGPVEQEIGLCFPEWGELFLCDDEGNCLGYVEHGMYDDGLMEDGDEGTATTGEDGNGDADEPDDENDGEGNGDDGDGDEDQTLNASGADDTGPVQPLFSCQSTGSSGLLPLLGVFLWLGRRRRSLHGFLNQQNRRKQG